MALLYIYHLVFFVRFVIAVLFSCFVVNVECVVAVHQVVLTAVEE